MRSKKPILLVTNNEELKKQCKAILVDQKVNAIIISDKIPEGSEISNVSEISNKINQQIVGAINQQLFEAILIDLRIYDSNLQSNTQWQSLVTDLVGEIHNSKPSIPIILMSSHPVCILVTGDANEEEAEGRGLLFARALYHYRNRLGWPVEGLRIPPKKFDASWKEELLELIEWAMEQNQTSGEQEPDYPFNEMVDKLGIKSLPKPPAPPSQEDKAPQDRFAEDLWNIKVTDPKGKVLYDLDATRRMKISSSEELKEGTPVKPATEQPRWLVTAFGAGMKRVLFSVMDAEASRAPLLILGDTGTGKELIARLVHNWWSKRLCNGGNTPFVEVNCGAIHPTIIAGEIFGVYPGTFTQVEAREGMIEAAQGGTLFLDEIASLSPQAQVMLLRVLQENRFHRVGEPKTYPLRVADVRIIAATNQDLRELIGKGEFREDLYYRLCQSVVTVPALWERPEYFEYLVGYLLAAGKSEGNIPEVKGVTKDAMEKLKRHDYPGNVRELTKALREAAQRAQQTPTKIIQEKHIDFERRVSQRSVFIIAKTKNEEWKDVYLLQYNAHWETYNFVGGRIRGHEKYGDAIIRKVKDELGLEYGTDYELEELELVTLKQYSKRDAMWKDYEFMFYFIEFLKPKQCITKHLDDYGRQKPNRESIWVSIEQIHHCAQIERSYGKTTKDEQKPRISKTVRLVEKKLAQTPYALEELPDSFE